MTGRNSWYFPLDPECPVHREYVDRLTNDPMSKYAPVDEILEAHEERHRIECTRCREYGRANADTMY